MLEGLAIYCFAAIDVLLFYLMFEATLIPMYFLIAGWGGPRRGQAAMKFLLYSLAGGLVMLFAVIGVGVHGGSFLLSDLAKVDFSGAIGKELFVGFFIAFAIKAPMVRCTRGCLIPPNRPLRGRLPCSSACSTRSAPLEC